MCCCKESEEGEEIVEQKSKQRPKKKTGKKGKGNILNFYPSPVTRYLRKEKGNLAAPPPPPPPLPFLSTFEFEFLFSLSLRPSPVSLKKRRNLATRIQNFDRGCGVAKSFFFFPSFIPSFLHKNGGKWGEGGGFLLPSDIWRSRGRKGRRGGPRFRQMSDLFPLLSFGAAFSGL